MTVDLREHIAEITYSHEAIYIGKNPSCDCGRWTGVVAGTESHADHLANEITDLLIDLAGTGRLLASIDRIARGVETR